MHPENLNGFVSVARGDDVIAFRNQNAAQSFAHRCVIVHDEDGFARHRLSGSPAGVGFCIVIILCRSAGVTSGRLLWGP